MDFLNIENLKNFDIERVAQHVAGALDEYPDRSKSDKVIVTSGAASKARVAAGAWEELDFEGQKHEWETLCDTLKKLQQQSDGQGAEKWQQRAKDAEYQLFKLCNMLLGLPDPAPFLLSTAALSAKIVDVEAQNRELKAASEAAAADAKEVGTLVEAHRSLEAAHKELQEQLASQSRELEEARAASTAVAAARKEAEEQAAEVARLQAVLRSLRDEHEHAQSALFEVQSRMEQEAGSRHREAELASEELERAHARITELELERSQLAQRLSAAAASATPSGAGGDGWDGDGVEEGLFGSAAGNGAVNAAGPDEFWERQLRLRGEQIGALQAQLDAAARGAQEAAARSEAQAQAHANQVAAAELHRSKLQAELAKRPEAKAFQELKSRCDALEQLVDVQMEAEGWGREDIRSMLTNVGAQPQAVHNMLQERNRKLASDLSHLKRALAEAQEEVKAEGARADKAAAEAVSQAKLVAKLEEDLAAVQARAKGASASSAVLLAAPGAGAAASGAADGAASAAAADSLAAGSLLAPSTPDSHGSESTGAGGMLDIVVSQRDRFRTRVTQLEEEKAALAEQLKSTQHTLDAVRADNVALYEKVRYLERYSQKAAAGGGRTTVLKVDDAGVALNAPGADARGARYQCGPLSFEIGAGDGAPDAVGLGGSTSAVSGGNMRPRGRKGTNVLCFPMDEPDEEAAGPEGRYSRAYEAKVNPFTEFQKHEVDSRVRNMQLHDRAVLAGSKLLVGSRMARVFIATYAVLLHLFIMVLLYYAMSPRTRVEMVDMDALNQQAEAAGAAAAGGTAAVVAAGAAAAKAVAGAGAMTKGAVQQAAAAGKAAVQAAPAAAQKVARTLRALMRHL